MRYLLHMPQTTRPQQRQWCLRTRKEKWMRQIWHSSIWKCECLRSSLFSHHIHHCFHLTSLVTSHPNNQITTITSQQSQSLTMLSGIHRLDSGRLVTSTSSFVFSSSLVLSSTISFSAIRSNQNFSAVSSGSSHERRKNSKFGSDMVVFTNAGLHADETPLTHRHPQRSSCCYP